MIRVTQKMGDRITVTIEANDDKEAFRKLGSAHEVYNIRMCGMQGCGGTDLRFNLRENEGNQFPEVVCMKCYARLAYGQKKGTTEIYPRRRFHKQHPLVVSKQYKEDDKMPDGGWERYERPAA